MNMERSQIMKLPKMDWNALALTHQDFFTQQTVTLSDLISENGYRPGGRVAYMNRLIDDGYERLGTGHWAEVFAKPTDKTVIKVGHNADIDGWITYTERLKKLKPNVHFPVVKNIEYHPSPFPSGKMWYTADIERLSPVEMSKKRITYQRWTSELEAFIRDDRPTSPDFPPSLLEAAKTLRDTFGSNNRWDFTYRNLMVRDLNKPSEMLVITDPLYRS